MEAQRIEIPLSKAKLLLVLGGAILFVALGAWLLLDVAGEESGYYRLFIQGVGLLGIVFFGFMGLIGVRKLFDNQPGLSIDREGIHDNSSAISAGLVEWKDITGFRSLKIRSTKFIMVDVEDPEKYIARAKNGIAKKAMQANDKLYGSPIAITSGALKYDFDQLEVLLAATYEQYTG